MRRWWGLALLVGCLPPVKDFEDSDGDGFQNVEWADCADDNSAVHPFAEELCNGKDDDCDGEPLAGEVDVDGDGVLVCAGDCDDARADVNPEAAERCDDGATDEDCDGLIDDQDEGPAGQVTWYADADGDGHGNADAAYSACEAPVGYVGDDRDCDDLDPDDSPVAIERCGDGEDNDCDGEIDEPDASDAEVWYWDGDEDGYGDAGVSTVSCEPEQGWVADDTDCDDSRSDINPAATEVCDALDNDCDDVIDEDDATDATRWTRDDDEDGFGDETDAWTSCVVPDGYVPADLGADCDDADATIYPGASESCDTVDQDCDGDTWDYGDHVTVAPTGSTYLSDRSTISAGISLAQTRGAGTTVCVAPGTYTETLTLDGSDGDIRVIGQQGALSTIVDAAGGGSTLTISSAGTTMEVQGLTLTGGYNLDGCGGGLSISGSPMLGDLIITDNEATLGGGLCVSDGAPQVSGTEIEVNRASLGGGLYVDDGAPVFTSVRMTGNTANPSSDGTGGGMYLAGGEIVLDTVVVEANEANRGAGIMLTGATVLRVDGLRVWSNLTDGGEGGGFYIDGTDGSPELVASHLDVRSNSASQGGAMYVGLGSSATVGITNAIFAGNDAYAYNIAIDLTAASFRISQATFIGNEVDADGGALAINADVSTMTFGIDNSTFYENTAGDEGGLAYLTTSYASTVLGLFTYCHYESNTPEDVDIQTYGTGNYTGCTPGLSDYDSADPATDWDLRLDSDTCLSGFGSGGVDIGAYGGSGGSTWPDDADWP